MDRCFSPPLPLIPLPTTVLPPSPSTHFLLNQISIKSFFSPFDPPALPPLPLLLRRRQRQCREEWLSEGLCLMDQLGPLFFYVGDVSQLYSRYYFTMVVAQTLHRIVSFCKSTFFPLTFSFDRRFMAPEDKGFHTRRIEGGWRIPSKLLVFLLFSACLCE